MDYIIEEKVIEDVKKMLAIPKVNGVLFHALQEMKYKYKHEIKQYKELESIIDHKENQTYEKKTAVKKVEFELEKKGKSFKVKPENEIPDYIIDHIIKLDIDTGQSHMERIKIEEGKTIDLVVTKHGNNYYTGSIKGTITPFIKDHPGKHLHQEVNQVKKMTSMDLDKEEELKKILNFLMVNEDFYDLVRRLLSSKWKSYLDYKNSKNKHIDKERIISG
jgi:hypothetical protein